MRIDVLRLPFSKESKISENIEFNKEKFICHLPLVEVLSTHVDVKIQRFEEFIYVTLAVKAKVVLQCSYSLKNFETTISGVDELHFAPNNDEDEDCIEYRGNIIELDEYIFNVLSSAVPLAPKAPNATLPTSGKGFRVLTDEDYVKEKQEKGNGAFDALKDLEIDG